MPGLDRRQWLARTVAGTGTLLLGGCDRLSGTQWFTRMLDSAATVNQRVQAFVTPGGAEGRQYTQADISSYFKSNGTHHPTDPTYQALARNNFADWRLELGGLVDHPMRLSLADLHAMPSVTQITRHDCVEGWSCIGQWTGVPLSTILARPRRAAACPLRHVLLLRYAQRGVRNDTTKASTWPRRIIPKPSWPTA